MQQREEKQLESALDSIIQRVNDLKASINSMICKVGNEYEAINWPTFLDNYAILSGHLTSLSKILSHDKSPVLRNLTVLPLLLSPERDEQLAQMTEHRVSTFAHDIVPDYLRTKLEPLAESKMVHFEQKAATLTYENAQKQVAAYQKVVTHVWDIVNKAREEWEGESLSRGNAQQNSSVADTNLLVAAVGIGKGLKVGPNGGPQGSGMMVAPAGRPGSSQGPNQMGTNAQQMNISKAPSGIKTNIKSATQIHPYGR